MQTIYGTRLTVFIGGLAIGGAIGLLIGAGLYATIVAHYIGII